MFAPTPMDLLVQIAVVREKIAAAFMKRRNVVACGIGFKIKDGHATNIPSVVVSVKRKQPRDQLPESELIPSVVENILTDVIETGPIMSLAIDRLGVVRPVQPGVSIAHRNGTAGTLGAIVQRGDQRFLLSNNHVLALLNSAQPGDLILQPGPSDGGTLNNTVGELAGFQPIRFIDEGEPQVIIIDDDTSAPSEPRGCAALISQLFGRRQSSSASPPRTTTITAIPENRVDAAIARPINETQLDARILDFDTAPLGIADPRLGMAVFKSGRSTGFTEGFIAQVDVTVDVEYNTRKARYVNQIMITPFSKRGDSGSLVLSGDRRAVGLIFSGSEVISVACPIRYVLAALQVELAAS